MHLFLLKICVNSFSLTLYKEIKIEIETLHACSWTLFGCTKFMKREASMSKVALYALQLKKTILHRVGRI